MRDNLFTNKFRKVKVNPKYRPMILKDIAVNRSDFYLVHYDGETPT